MTFANINIGGDQRQGAGSKGVQDTAIAVQEAQTQGVFMQPQRVHIVVIVGCITHTYCRVHHTHDVIDVY